MRNLKKFLALVLAMMMAMSLMVTANAAVTANVEYDDSYQVNDAFAEAVTVLSGMGVIKGYNGGESFQPKSNITRAEAATLVYRLATADVEGEKDYLYTDYALQSTLKDVTADKWYAGAVGYCANFGIVKGRSDGLFHANDPVTGYEILAMILRVVGYDKKGEFSGADWAYNVSTLATSLGVVDKVKTANYSAGGTSNLYAPATREVVASLLFETITRVPKVTFSESLSYRDTVNLLGTGEKNATVGFEMFGLKSNTGIVVGNQATGESNTKIGFDGTIRWNSNGNNNGGTVTDGVSSKNANTAYQYDSNTTYAFKWDSGLDYFGHAVKVWYDGRSDMIGARPTYAVTDQAVKTDVVDGATGSLDITLTSPADGDLAKEAGGFKMGSNTYWNYSFGRTLAKNFAKSPAEAVTVSTPAKPAYIDPDTGGLVPAIPAGSSTVNTTWQSDVDTFRSPIMVNNGKGVTAAPGSTAGNHPLYLLISNSSDNTLDLVVSLDMTITQITQSNRTTGDFSVGVYNGNGVHNSTRSTDYPADNATQYFDTQDSVGALLNSGSRELYSITAAAGQKSYANIYEDAIVAGSTKTLGDKIAAIEVTGTATNRAGNVVVYGNNTDNKSGNYDDETRANVGTAISATTPASALAPTSNYYYSLNKLNHVVPGTVIRVNQKTQEVFLSDGSSMKRSVFADAVDGDFKNNEYVNAPTVLATYNFTLDEKGNYIYWEPITQESTFVYGTYMDYNTELASSAFVYPLVYVDTNGERGQKNVTKLDSATIDWNVYTTQQLNRRSGNILSTDSGYVRGAYVGYAMSDSGTLRSENATGDAGTGFKQAAATNFGYDRIPIGEKDTVIGAVQVPNNGSNVNLFLTNNTKFYIVDGAGLANQKVTPYNGLSALMANMSSVVIDARQSYTAYGASNGTTHTTYGESPLVRDKSTYLAQTNDPYQQIYYQAGRFDYAQGYDVSAQEIKTIYIPSALIKFTPKVDSSLFFVGESDSRMINSTGPVATRFAMYQNGEETYRWIKGHWNDSTTNAAGEYESDAYIVANFGTGANPGGNDNVFYCLIPTSDKANDNETIYQIEKVADNVRDASEKVIGKWYTGNRTSASSGVSYTINPKTDPSLYTSAPKYSATTYSTQIAYIGVNDHDAASNQLYNVGNAIVKNLDKITYPGIVDKNLTSLNEAGSITSNIGVDVSCVLSSEDSNHLTVSVVYVNADES